MKRMSAAAFILAAIFTCNLLSGMGNERLYKRFLNPPQDTKIQNYWFWLNGFVTKEGIEKDLVAMKNAGVGGVILLNGNMYRCFGGVDYGTDSWWDCLSFSMRKADSLGLTFGMYNSDGWSMSGGPWIEVEESMKMITSASTTVTGGGRVSIDLPQPDFNVIYHDVAILAFPAMDRTAALRPRVASSSLVSKPELLLDGDPATLASFVVNTPEKPWVTFDFGQVRTFRRMEVENSGASTFLENVAMLEYSADGLNFFPVDIVGALNYKSLTQEKRYTLSFPALDARFFRLTISAEVTGRTPTRSVQGRINLGELRFFESAAVDHWEGKSARTMRIRHDRQQFFQQEMNAFTDEDLPQGQFIDRSSIIDLSSRVSADGHLDWDAPEGEWTILRTGYTSTLKMNGPASPQGRGYECNKLDSKAVEKHFYGYVAKANDLSLKVTGKPIHVMQMESWEAGTQNWTDGFERMFEEINGYSIIPWLPVMTEGYVVDGYEQSNRFLWDLRKTISEMMADNYWGTMHRLCREHGILTSNEGSGMQQFLYDPINYMQHSDIPMGEFWRSEEIVRADCKNAASVAHIHGLKKASGEAFTSSGDRLWSIAPYGLKRIGDEAFTNGVNHFVLHCYVHQPFDIGPGLTLKAFGNHFQRLNTWYPYMNGWTDYLHRSQTLLQEGASVIDVCYFTGEGIPGYLGLRSELKPELPSGYDYDGVNLSLLKSMKVKGGRLVLPNGISYALLVVRDGKLTPAAVAEIGRLVSAGATVVAPKPSGSPSLSGYPSCDVAVREVADLIWGNAFDGVSVTRHDYGRGRVIWGEDLSPVLEECGCKPDFTYESDPAVRINYIHRKTSGEDIYFVANFEETDVSTVMRFRSSRRKAQLWDPDRGTIHDLECTRRDGISEVRISLEGLGSRFVVFSDHAAPSAGLVRKTSADKEIALDSGWAISFQGGRKMEDSALFDWLDEPSTRYFSGSAVYSRSFTLESAPRECVLDLGDVKSIAVVKVNGRQVANLWRPPYRIDISDYTVRGVNGLEVIVVNSWINHLVGDEHYPMDVEYIPSLKTPAAFPEWLSDPSLRQSQRTTFVSCLYPMTEAYLEPSGLKGPVKVLLR